MTNRMDSEKAKRVALELLEQLKGKGLTFTEVQIIISQMRDHLSREMKERAY